ncbi:MAG: hypothetical protein ACLQBA_07650 [Candidatus Binataceae bacterium]
MKSALREVLENAVVLAFAGWWILTLPKTLPGTPPGVGWQTEYRFGSQKECEDYRAHGQIALNVYENMMPDENALTAAAKELPEVRAAGECKPYTD